MPDVLQESSQQSVGCIYIPDEIDDLPNQKNKQNNKCENQLGSVKKNKQA